jgi:hypothetical protein
MRNTGLIFGILLGVGLGLLFAPIAVFLAEGRAYRQGQIDAAEGRWKYTPATQRVYVERD